MERNEIIEVKIEKLVFGGQGLGYHEDLPVFVWNVLPGELVRARVIKRRKGIIEGVAEEILEPSKDRLRQKEEHYLSCSPWQMMTFEAEQKYKKEIAVETFRKLGGIELPDIEIVTDGKEYGYRNKMEYSFFTGEDDRVELALHYRGSRHPRPIDPCLLASDPLNDTARFILDWIRENNISRWDLKTLIVRSNRSGETIAGLFVTNPDLDYSNLPKLDGALHGVHIFYSTLKSPASVITEVLVENGRDWLEERLLDTTLRYGLHSFFQVNIPVFEQTLGRISSHIPNGADVVDFYSGVGSISIPLKNKISSAVLVDNNEEAIGFAQGNINLNKLSNYSAQVAESEKLLEELTSDRTIILDPPRAGLHPDVVGRITEVLPEDIIYLSCNVSTQARDLGLLKERYVIIDSALYNYFPSTPHFESLVVLKKK